LIARKICNQPESKRFDFSFVSYGVRIGIQVSEPSVLELLRDYLPPGWEPSFFSTADVLYSLILNEPPGCYQLYRGQEELVQTRDLEDIFLTFDSDLRLQVGLLVEDKLFVHAGVVGWRGGAIAIPGRSFSGKTTLVAALVKAGATYYSDEYALFDAKGLVYPYPRRLSIRRGADQWERRSVEELGGKVGMEPLPLKLVVYTQYQPGSVWQPHQLSPGEAVLALLDNTIVARTRPEFALPILSCAVNEAVAWEGERGEAESLAAALLQ
jgi:hypothetical protein